MRFKDKVVLVLGGNSGMGLAAAQAFAAEGGKVHLTGRDQATIDAAVASIPGSTGYSSDISDIAATEDVVAKIEAADGRIDVLYINAGVGGFAPLRGITEEAWDHVHAINLKGCVFALQKARADHGQGRIDRGHRLDRRARRRSKAMAPMRRPRAGSTWR